MVPKHRHLETDKTYDKYCLGDKKNSRYTLVRDMKCRSLVYFGEQTIRVSSFQRGSLLLRRITQVGEEDTLLTC